MHRIAFVVPTKDRPEDLRRLLSSLVVQTRMPDQIIVVDASDPPVASVVEEFRSLPVQYERHMPPSLAKQRNAGMRKVTASITLAGYLDDDVVLEPDAVARMIAFWEAADPKVGGAAFNIVNNPAPGGLRLKEIFGIDAAKPGIVLASGFPSSIPRQHARIETEWLYGGATVWRREVVDQFGYDEWFVGTGFMEDIDYSFNVRSRYTLALVADARLTHNSRPVRPDRQYLLGVWQIVNRMYVVQKYRSRGLSPARAWWATFGVVMLNTAAAIRRADRAYWNRARGNLSGIISVIRGTRVQVGGHLK